MKFIRESKYKYRIKHNIHRILGEGGDEFFRQVDLQNTEDMSIMYVSWVNNLRWNIQVVLNIETMECDWFDEKCLRDLFWRKKPKSGSNAVTYQRRDIIKDW